MRRVFLDTEFIPHLTTTRGTLSVGMVDDSGNKLYFENRDAHWDEAVNHAWIAQNVLPHMKFGSALLSLYDQRLAVYEFFKGYDRRDTIVYAWCGSQDLVRIHALWDHDWQVMPKYIPHWFQDIEALAAGRSLPTLEQTFVTHNALDDAYYNMHMYNALTKARVEDTIG